MLSAFIRHLFFLILTLYSGSVLAQNDLYNDNFTQDAVPHWINTLQIIRGGSQKAAIGVNVDKFQIYTGTSSNNGTARLTINQLGNVGIGTTNPSERLHVMGNIRTQNNHNGITKLTVENNSVGDATQSIFSLLGSGVGVDFGLFGQGNTGAFVEGLARSKTVFFRTQGSAPANRLIFGTGSASPIHFFTDDITRLFIDELGDIGIGTILPDSKLTVNGDIHATAVKVDLNGALAPDFVFEENYHLLSLEETEKYIEVNNHLPEVPSAMEMEENGLELKAMNLKLLQKIEELTLHLIDQNKEIKSLKEKMTKLEENQ